MIPVKLLKIELIVSSQMAIKMNNLKAESVIQMETKCSPSAIIQNFNNTQNTATKFKS